jgi:hypothetical protein
MTGIGPVELLADDHIFDAIVDVHAERAVSGYQPTEMAASSLEMLHGLYRLLYTVYAKEGAPPLEPLTVRRPGQPVSEPQATPTRHGVLRRTVADIISAGGRLRGS